MPAAAPALRVLGPIEVAGASGGPIGLGDRQRALLAVLLASPNRTVPADVLVDAAWADDRDRTAALHTQISRLRRALEDGAVPAAIRTHPGGYAVEVDDDAVDAGRFRHLCEQAGSAADPSDAASLLGDALALWRGPAFGSHADLAPIEAVAARLDEERLGAIERRAGALLEAGRPELAIPDLDAFVREHPLREGARELLMRGLYAVGRQSEALQQYQRHREELAEQLGIEPSVALQRLEGEILRQEVDVPAVTAAPARRPPMPLDSLAVTYVHRRDGEAIACATVGEGPSVVSVPAWVTSLEIIGQGRDPRSSVLERLGHKVRLTMYDRFGTGLSPGPVADFSLDTTVDELVAVLERTGPSVLLAVSQAGPAAVSAAVRRPDLVRGLVLFGTFARADATFPDERTREASVELLRAHWGMGSRLLASLYRPGSSDEAAEHLARVMRESAPPEVAAGYLTEMFRTDVSGLLASVTAPALVMHYTGDRVIPFRGGQLLAAGLPDSLFVPLEGRYHLPDAHDLDRIVRTIVDFTARTSAVPG